MFPRTDRVIGSMMVNFNDLIHIKQNISYLLLLLNDIVYKTVFGIIPKKSKMHQQKKTKIWKNSKFSPTFQYTPNQNLENFQKKL